MHSLKNTVVAVLLLGVSYGVYNVLTTPDPSVDEAALIGPITIDNGTVNSESLDSTGFSATLPSGQLSGEFPAASRTANDFGQAATNRLAGAMESTNGLAGSTSRNLSEFKPNVRPNTPPALSENTSPGLALPEISERGAEPRAPGNQQVSVPDANTQLIPGIAVRQPQYNFASGNRTASADLPTGAADPEDQVLIDALKNELQPANDLDIFSTPAQSAQPKPAANRSAGNSNAFKPAGSGTTFVSAPESRDATVSFDLPDAASPASRTESAEPAATLSSAWTSVDKLIAEGNYRGALGSLSRFYTDTSLTGLEQEKLMTWLDSLAGKVIYSPEHNLYQSGYKVQDGDTLTTLARRWNVTSQLIYNVNRPNISNPSVLEPGSELKMITGPFHAELDLENGTMTLFVKNLYAGRFNIRVGRSTEIPSGSYAVTEKSRDLGGGTWTLTLEGGLCIKTIAEGETVPDSCIGLDPTDSSDVFGILTGSSRIFIK